MMRGVIAAALALTVFGCSEEPTAPTMLPPPPPTTPAELKPVPHQVVVVNTLSETLSRLDPDSGEMNVQAAVVGTWVNRITADEFGQWLLVTNSGANQIEVLDPASLAPMAVVDLGTGRSPWTAVAISASDFLVTNWLSGTIRRATAAGTLVGDELETQRGPEGIATQGGLAWIACTNYRSDGSFGEGRVDVVDLTDWDVVTSIPVGRNPQEVMVASDGRIHVLCTGAATPEGGREVGSVSILDPTTHRVIESVVLGGSPGRMTEDLHGVVWVVGFAGGLRRYDATSLDLLPDPEDATLRGPGLSGVAVDPLSDAVYVTHFDGDLLIKLDRASVSVADAWVVGDGPVDVLVQVPDEAWPQAYRGRE